MFGFSRKPSPRSVVIIEYGGKYWTGYKFIKNKQDAMAFPSHDDAWEYIDTRFCERDAEMMALERR